MQAMLTWRHRNPELTERSSLPGRQARRFHLLVSLALLLCQSATATVIFHSNFEDEGGLNDTGYGGCATATTANVGCPQAAFPDQDGDHGRDALRRLGQLPKIGGGEGGFDFTKISNSGNPLPAGAALGAGANDWGCTRDNVSGLILEVKVNNAASLRHMSHSYTWYDTNPAVNGGYAGVNVSQQTCNGTLSQCNTSAFVVAVNAQSLCGANDWRMPTPEELLGIT